MSALTAIAIGALCFAGLGFALSAYITAHTAPNPLIVAVITLLVFGPALALGAYVGDHYVK
jgi:uncharacterized membrane protein YccC